LEAGRLGSHRPGTPAGCHALEVLGLLGLGGAVSHSRLRYPHVSHADGTVWLVSEPRKWFGLAGTLTRGLDGLREVLPSPHACTGPRIIQDDEQPEKFEQHQ
jgi:hypothetical protein